MKNRGWTGLAAGFLVLAATAPAGMEEASGPAAGGPAIVYEVTELKGKLLCVMPDGKQPVAAGDRFTGGQRLRTGWFSASDLLAPDYGSRFHLGSRTRVRLASDTPGVLLELERGRLRALFDKLSGQEPVERRIETPSAILAVRGTEYGVAVDGSGDTTLVVFSGAVEVSDREGREAPVRVEAGFTVRVRRGQLPGAPRPHGLTQGRWDRGATPSARDVSAGDSRGASSPQSGRQGGGSRRRGG